MRPVQFFNAGDKVKCTGMREYYDHKLVIGETYTVHSHIGRWVMVEENDYRNCYESHYFQLVGWSPKIKTEMERSISSMIKSLRDK
jgi:hypothetical protein